MRRRTFIASSAQAVFGALAMAQTAKAKRILVASQWHNVNIGEIAHGPGLVRLIERHLPDVEFSLWPGRTPMDEIRGMTQREFPKLTIIEGTVSTDGRPSTPEFVAEFARCDLRILASVGCHPITVEGWRPVTGAPCGVFGNGFHQEGALTPALAEQVLDIRADSQAARAKVGAAMERVNTIRREVFTIIGCVLAA